LLSMIERRADLARLAGMMLLLFSITAAGFLSGRLENPLSTAEMFALVGLASAIPTAVMAGFSWRTQGTGLGSGWQQTAFVAALLALVQTAVSVWLGSSGFPAYTYTALTIAALLIAWSVGSVRLTWAAALFAFAAIVHRLLHNVWNVAYHVPWMEV